MRSKIEIMENKKMVCPNCGKELKNDDLFCSKCGTKRDAKESEYNEYFRKLWGELDN